MKKMCPAKTQPRLAAIDGGVSGRTATLDPLYTPAFDGGVCSSTASVNHLGTEGFDSGVFSLSVCIYILNTIFNMRYVSQGFCS